jgi:hypothetical protein
MDRAILTERRRSARRQPESHESLGRVRLRTGRELAVIDIAPGGVLVEGTTRLLPNTHLDLHVVTRTGRVLVRCRVLRAVVCHLEADVVRYRVALSFDRMVDTAAGYAVPLPISGDFAPAGIAYPAGEAGGEPAEAERRSA